jgi:uncharacterized protein (UPF0218 family)
MSFNPTNVMRIDRKLRTELSKPFGEVMTASRTGKTITAKDTIYAVGDVTVSTVLGLGLNPKLAIFDYRSGRSRRNFPAIRRTYRMPVEVTNPRGELSLDLWSAIRKASKSKLRSSIRVHGEEDLASLACIHFSKNGSIVMYGLRGKGIAIIHVDDKIKAYVDGVLKRMSKISQ